MGNNCANKCDYCPNNEATDESKQKLNLHHPSNSYDRKQQPMYIDDEDNNVNPLNV